MNPVIPVYEPFVGEEEAEAVADAPRRGDTSGSFSRRLEVVLRRRTRRLLDVARGTGRHAVEFVARGIEVPGVDLNEQLLAHAPKRAPEIEFLAQAAGKARTRREHTYRHRLRELLELLKARM